jgi:hypothetical protein
MTFCGFMLALTYVSFDQGRRDRDRMVVGFITTYAIGVYHH